jgi:hypothetical protein
MCPHQSEEKRGMMVTDSFPAFLTLCQYYEWMSVPLPKEHSRVGSGRQLREYDEVGFSTLASVGLTIRNKV